MKPVNNPQTTGRELYRTIPCLICFGEPTCFAHYPRHRGMGGGHAGWGLLEGLPLCSKHHELLDRRMGKWDDQTVVRELVAKLAPLFWAHMLILARAGYYLGPKERIMAVEEQDAVALLIVEPRGGDDD